MRLIKIVFVFLSYRKSQVQEQQYHFNYITRRCIISAAYYNFPRNISQETGQL